jgi:hypothetical protein
MNLTGEDATVGFIGAVVIAILIGVCLVNIYHYGYYEGRSNVLDNQVCVPREKPAK